MKKTVSIITLGCRVNQYESCAVAEALTANGYEVVKNGVSDYYIVNTCTVTAESQRKSKQLVRRCAEKGKVLVMGCASQIDPSFADIENVIYVCGNREKMSVVDVLYADDAKCGNGVISMENAPFEEMHICGNSDLFSECRAFIKIQDGCNGKCTYCIIPKCRGSVRSREADHIINEAARLIKKGYKEIILTGIEVSAYNKIPLPQLIKSVSELKGLERLRLGSLTPNRINVDFMETVSKCVNFMPHIHLSLQSCCDEILTAMKRPYKKADVIDKVNLIRKYIPNCIITADIIVGFPGETEEMFKETVDTLKALQFFHVHSFPYSEREGTPAAVMPNSVPKAIRSERNNCLISEINIVKENILSSMYGKEIAVLVEKIKDGYAYGHTEEFIEAKLINKDYTVGSIVKAVGESQENGILTATPI